MDMFYKHKVLNIVKKPLLLKHDCGLESMISQAGRSFVKPRLYKKLLEKFLDFIEIFQDCSIFFILRKN